MSYTIGELFQIQLSPATYRLRITCPELTEQQFGFLDRMLDESANDTYPDLAHRTTTVVFESDDPNGFRDQLTEQIVDTFIRRCCNPNSPRFITDAEYALIDGENSAPV